MLSIFTCLKTHPPCNAGIIMTITTVMAVITELTLFDLQCNMDDLLTRKYAHRRKKQRTIETIYITPILYKQVLVFILLKFSIHNSK